MRSFKNQKVNAYRDNSVLLARQYEVQESLCVTPGVGGVGVGVSVGGVGGGVDT